MKQKIGRFLILVVILNTFLTPILFWADDIHFLNDAWVDHAKYHLVWQGNMVMLFHIVALYLVIFKWNAHKLIPLITAGIPGLTWLAFILSAFVVMPVLGFESEIVFPHHNIVNGIDFDNMLVIFTFLVAVAGYWLARPTEATDE